MNHAGHKHHTFHWKCYLLKIHQIEKLNFLGISRYQCKSEFWLNSNLYRGTRVSRFGEFRRCSIFSSNFHMGVHMNELYHAHADKWVMWRHSFTHSRVTQMSPIYLHTTQYEYTIWIFTYTYEYTLWKYTYIRDVTHSRTVASRKCHPFIFTRHNMNIPYEYVHIHMNTHYEHIHLCLTSPVHARTQYEWVITERTPQMNEACQTCEIEWVMSRTTHTPSCSTRIYMAITEEGTHTYEWVISHV